MEFIIEGTHVIPMFRPSRWVISLLPAGLLLICGEYRELQYRGVLAMSELGELW